MNKKQIDNVICGILYLDGPDMHIDGHDIIVDFIMALLDGKGEQWLKDHKEYLKWSIKYGE